MQIKSDIKLNEIKELEMKLKNKINQKNNKNIAIKRMITKLDTKIR
jgi:hypothetical protein